MEVRSRLRDARNSLRRWLNQHTTSRREERGIVEPLERRVLLSTVKRINASGGDWNTASNWSTGVIPGASDDAVINVSGNPPITFSSGTASVHSITSNSPLTISGGALTAMGTIGVNNSLTVSGSGSVILDGAVLNSDLTLNGGFVGVRDGLTLSGTITLTGSTPTLDFQNTETLTGGTILFQSTLNSYIDYMDIEGGSTLTLGSGVTIHGDGGIIGHYVSSGSAATLIKALIGVALIGVNSAHFTFVVFML